MIAPAYAWVMAAYNRWMNERLHAVCADIPDEERKRDRGAYFKSIHGTLNHLMFGDRVWLGRFIGGDRYDPNSRYYAPKTDTILFEDFDALRRERAWLDAQIERWAAALDADWLARTFSYTALDGRTITFPSWVLVTHMFNHGTHHRGQLSTLLMQLGIDPGVTDLAALPGVRALATSETAPT